MNEGKIESLGTALPREMKRCRKLLVEYNRIGAAGAFGAASIEVDLDFAEKALASGDVIKMIRAYTNLQKCE